MWVWLCVCDCDCVCVCVCVCVWWKHMNDLVWSNLPMFSDQACETGGRTEGKQQIKIKNQTDHVWLWNVIFSQG